MQRLREVRRAELERSLPAGPSAGADADEHRSSLTQVHDDVRSELVRIDAAEAAMRPVLQAWSRDPARGGAHLLAQEGHEDDPASTAVFAQATAPWPTAPVDEQLPDTVMPGPTDTP